MNFLIKVGVLIETKKFSILKGALKNFNRLKKNLQRGHTPVNESLPFECDMSDVVITAVLNQK